jgi:hypothetical protein
MTPLQSSKIEQRLVGEAVADGAPIGIVNIGIGRSQRQLDREAVAVPKSSAAVQSDRRKGSSGSEASGSCSEARIKTANSVAGRRLSAFMSAIGAWWMTVT